MKLLYDQNLSFKLCTLLSDLFPDSKPVRELGLDRSDDRIVWQHAKDNGLMLVSQDSDFADMAAHYGHPPKVIWLRCGNQPVAAVEALLRRHANDIVECAAVLRARRQFCGPLLNPNSEACRAAQFHRGTDPDLDPASRRPDHLRGKRHCPLRTPTRSRSTSIPQ